VENRVFEERISVGMQVAYRIKVMGHIGAEFSESLAGLKITINNQESQSQITILEGFLKDQAELMGVLNNLKGLKHSILEVELTSIGRSG
jgi:hypothetical protein